MATIRPLTDVLKEMLLVAPISERDVAEATARLDAFKRGWEQEREQARVYTEAGHAPCPVRHQRLGDDWACRCPPDSEQRKACVLEVDFTLPEAE